MRRLQAQRGSSGQVLVITSLIVAMLLLSTVLYVRETQLDSPSAASFSTLSFVALKQAVRHTVTSALANVSNGGAPQLLQADLNQLKYFVANSSYPQFINMNYAALTDEVYSGGFCFSWASNGTGVSSAYVSVSLSSTAVSTEYSSEFSVNVTSKIGVAGEYELLTESNKQVNVTCSFYSEGGFALARNFTVYYEYDGDLSSEEWLTPTSLTVLDYGNGTYLCSFTAATRNRSDPLVVSVRGVDARGILTVANVTCVLR